MKLRILKSMAGTDYVRNVGDECEIEDEEAHRLIDAGIAEPVEGKSKNPRRKNTPETATEI